MKGKRKPKQKPKGNPGAAFLLLTLFAGLLLLAFPNVVGGFIVVLMYLGLIAHYQGAKKRDAAQPDGAASKNTRGKNMKASFRASKPARGVVRHDDEPFELFDENSTPTPGFAIPRAPKGLQGAATGEKLRKPNRPSAADCWVPRDVAFTVHQYRIHVGLVYCGTGLESVAARGEPEPALVNEKLEVGADDEYSTRKLEYYPSYATATPDARAGYLNWLANGRRDKKANIGYVYLYFYGLERRAFIDAHSDPVARAEIPSIIDEVEALLKVYTKSKAFVERAKNFANTLRAVAEGSRKYLDQPPSLAIDEGRSYLHSVALAQAYRDDFAYPVEWLLSWYLASTEFDRPRAVVRCLKHFQSLFRLELPKQFPDNPGEWVDARQARRLTLTYKAVYPRLGTVEVAMPESDNLRDVIDPSLNLRTLVDSLARNVAAQLEMYSRYVGNSAEKAASDEAQLLLPRALWAPALRTRLESISDSVSGSRTVSTPVKFSALFAPLNPRFVAGYFRNVVSHLESAFGLCMEPDPRYGTALPTLESSVVFFRGAETPQIPDGEVLPPEVLAAWLKKTSVVWFYAAIVRADPSNQEAKRAAAGTLIAHIPGLSSVEKARLHALFEVLVTDMPTAGLRKRAQDFTSNEATRVASELVQICQAGGGLTGVANIRTLEKLFEMLGQDANELYSMAHAGAAVAVDGERSGAGLPATGATSGDAGNRDAADLPAFGLDRERMARLRAETAQASAMLGAIFLQDETPPMVGNAAAAELPNRHNNAETAPVDDVVQDSGLLVAQATAGGDSQTVAPVAVLLPGLNDAHHSLLVRLLEKDAWERSEIGALCSSFGLMVDAAIERINDAAFNKFDDSLLEGDETFEINMDIAGELRA
jgi:hypothetical protein